MNFLVTGGAGFIGSNITDFLINQGYSVIVLDNLTTGNQHNIRHLLNHKNFTFIEGDIRSYHIVNKILPKIDYVIHQAALPSVPRSINDPITSNVVNIDGTLNLLECAVSNKVKRFVFASSSSIYGNTEVLPKHPSMPVNPMSPYALTKYTGERYCQIFYDVYGLETVSLRYFNVFGPRQNPFSEYSAAIPKFVKLLLDGNPPIIYGDGLQSRDFTYVDNVVEANFKACFAPNAAGKVFNVALGERITLLDLISKINKKLGKNITPIFESVRLGDVKHSLACIKDTKEILGYTAPIDFDTGLEKTVDYFIDYFSKK